MGEFKQDSVLQPQIAVRAKASWPSLENVGRAAWKGNTNNLQLPALEKTHWRVPSLREQLSLKLKLHCEQHQLAYHRTPPTRRGAGQGPPTCQVSLQGGRGALVPSVATEEEEPDQEGGQHQHQDPEDPGHSWVSDSPGRQDIHAEGWWTVLLHYQGSLISRAWLQYRSWMGRSGPVCRPCAASGACSRKEQQPQQRQPQMDTSCSRRSPAQTSAHVSSVCEGVCVCVRVCCISLSPGEVRKEHRLEEELEAIVAHNCQPLPGCTSEGIFTLRERPWCRGAIYKSTWGTFPSSHEHLQA